mgnify:CR=1 FL=1
METLHTTLDLIGNTPLVRLKGPSEAAGCDIFGKCEFTNPGASVKDRAALYIVRDAEERGALKPGGTLRKILVSTPGRESRYPPGFDPPDTYRDNALSRFLIFQALNP